MRKYVTYSSSQVRRLNDNGTLYERPGKAEVKRCKSARQKERSHAAGVSIMAEHRAEMGALLERSGLGVRGVSEVTATLDA